MADRRGIHRLLNPAAIPMRTNALRNKQAFARIMREYGLPIPSTFFEPRANLPDWLSERTRLIAKPSFSSKGTGVIAFERRSDGWYDGRVLLNEEELLTVLDRILHRGGIVQDRATTHPEFRGISPGALPTVRVMSFAYRTGEIVAFAPVVRLSRDQTGAVDNFNAGNLVSAISPDNRLDAAWGISSGRIERFSNHPLTGRPIADCKVPSLGQILELARRAHEPFAAGFGMIGWDIGLTDMGPSIIEGNWNPGTDIIQLAMQTGLDALQIGECYRTLLDTLPEEAWRNAKPIQFDILK
ncbi:sugar-transfer associated ATP-grasp domain-containing protein [Erythrobacter litoralis]|uniref:sugar-transfer associated ATP-grasp domain-containing protein n=1 Tax=Erythrobacter litoralis TaxID=39960 RepID=UPI002434889C|nr:sugar-transfer associated ATP-grasp domain-containing protein [Erythrobacter litoralis]